MTGILRVLFAAAVGATLIALLVGLVTSVYQAPPTNVTITQPPGSTAGSFTSYSYEESPAHNRYERNVGVILSLAGTGIMAGSILGLRASLNPLRCGGLAGGLVVFLVGTGFASAGASDWLEAVWALLAFVTLILCSRRLADGWPGIAIGA